MAWAFGAQGPTQEGPPKNHRLREREDSQRLFLYNELSTVIIENRAGLQSPEERRPLFIWFRERSDFKLLFERNRGVRRDHLWAQ